MANTPATRVNGAAITSLVSSPVPAGAGGLWWDGNTTGPLWRKADGSDITLGAGGGSTGNWVFSANQASIAGGYTLTGGAASTVTTTVGGLTLSAAGTVNVQNTSGAVVLGNTSGITTIRAGSTGSFDMSAANGVFKTTSGAHTFGSASWAVPANTVITGASSATNTTGLSTVTTVADGATSIAFDYNNAATFSTTGWKMARWRNNGTEFASLSGSQLAAGGLRFSADGSAFIDMSLNGATNIGYSSNYIGIGSGSCIFNGQGPRSDGTTTLGASGSPWPSAFISRPVITSQIIAAASSITVNPANGNYVRINLSATAITSLTISAGQNGEVMYVEVVEDATGTRTIPTTWTNVSFPTGGYTASAGANKHDMLVFVYNSTFSKWVNTSQVIGNI